MKKKLSVGVLFGGRSGEHEVSLVSAASVMRTLDPKKYIVTPIGISKTGEWFTGKNVLDALKKGNTRGLIPVLSELNKKSIQSIDVIFPLLHGPYGEDGTVQGLCEMLDLPYVGCGVGASAAAMDKFTSKMIFKAYGFAQAPFLHVTAGEVEKKFSLIEREILKKLGLPCFVKPSNLGSSVGISKVKKRNDLRAALKLAASYDSSIIIEQGIDAREIECAVLGNENPRCSIPGEIVPNREFYDFYAKYVDNASELFIPARISKKTIQEAQKLAIDVYTSLQCSGMARVDFLMDRKTEKLYINEVNTIPGFTSISMYPKLWAASGLPYPQLLDELLRLALERHREKKRHMMSFASGSSWYT